MSVRLGLMLVLAGCLSAPAPALAQAQAPVPTLTLAQALDRAGRAAYANRIADAQALDQAGQAAQAMRGVLPSARVEGGYVRTTEPLGAFGFTLRQRNVTPAAFDPARLNDPPATGNLASAIVIEQPLINLDAVYGRQAAARASAAARAAAAWTRTGTALDVVRAYYGALLATESAVALDSAARAAHAHERAAESRYRNGVATRSDALLAAVRAGQLDAELLGARSDARLARMRLAVVLGAPADTAFGLPDRLPDTLAIARLAGEESPAAGDRADVRAARLAALAAEANGRRAAALLLPRVNSFARLDWNSAGTPFGGRDAWTIGVLVSWSPFGGGSELAERRIAAARTAGARASADAAAATSALEVEEARAGLAVAVARMAIAGTAVDQAAEAHRIVTRKYAGGLATAVELFDAASMETSARLDFARSRYAAIIAAAQSRRAHGGDIGGLTSLDGTE